MKSLFLFFINTNISKLKFFSYTLKNIKTLLEPYMLFDFGETGRDALLHNSPGPYH